MSIKSIAIYLPQFHAIPENDKAWGEGFTEWTNVRKAKPLFDEHYQPHVPHETVGYYDLSDPEVMVRQAAMAKEYGIYGFAFYHYWFNGKRLLETPLDNMLKTGKPDFPFLYIWANENWTKRWDGLDNEVIMKQDYSREDDLNHIRFLCENVFSDKRYISIDDKPVFMVYRTELMPDIKETAMIWREEAKKYGFKDLYLVRVEGFVRGINPNDIGFDAAMEFGPDWDSVDASKTKRDIDTENATHDYISTIDNISLKLEPNYPLYRCVFPAWDNSPRKSFRASTFVNNNPQAFRQFFYRISEYTKKRFTDDSQFIFVNAWNEWGEGCHLEPDVKNGDAYLRELKNLLNDTSGDDLRQYVDFLEKNLVSRIKERNELMIIKEDYKRFVNSNGHRLMEVMLKKYRQLKKHIRNSR